jgi:predicted site-specific integrase-resolvase
LTGGWCSENSLKIGDLKTNRVTLPLTVDPRRVMAKRKAGGSRKRVALYLRVSTTGQNTTNQRRELETVAERHGWAVVQVFSDNGISGEKGRKDRPGLDALLKGVARREFDMVAAWSVDRLAGRCRI